MLEKYLLDLTRLLVYMYLLKDSHENCAIRLKITKLSYIKKFIIL